jgi:hypothetical protein
MISLPLGTTIRSLRKTLQEKYRVLQEADLESPVKKNKKTDF